MGPAQVVSGCFGSGYIAIADYRNAFYRFGHLANAFQVDHPFKSLGPGTAVYKNGSHTGIFQCPGEIGGG